MKKTLSLTTLLVSGFIIGCNPGDTTSPDPGNGGGGTPEPPANQAPIANATISADEVTGAVTVTLDASGSSDADGDALSFQWSQTQPATPQAQIQSVSAAITDVQLTNVTQTTDYTFEVIVNDGQDATAATVTLRQQPTNTNNRPPVAAITASQSQITGAASITLDGSGSSDEDGDSLTYQWQQLQPASPQATIATSTAASTNVDFAATDTAINYTFQLTVDDGEATASQTIQIAQTPATTPPTDGFTIAASELRADEAALTDSPLFAAVKQSVATTSNTVVDAISPLNASNPANVKRVEGIISSDDWDFLFARRASEYTYTNFLKAVAKFPGFCATYDSKDSDAICRKALATMFAHFAQETGGHAPAWAEPEWRQGLFYLREVGWTETATNGYGICDPSTWQAQAWPCGTFSNGSYKSYFGRGAKQLSYNYNYGPFSQAMFGDVSVLLNNPEMVADTWLNLASAIFFFVYPQPPKPSMLHVIDGSWQPNANDTANGLVPGFGVTTQIINGGIECGGSSEHIQSQNRINYYREIANYLNISVPADEVLGCANMNQFDSGGAGALNISWEQDYGWKPDTPDNKSYACQLVTYQTAYSALIPDDYIRCVENFFDVMVDYSR